MLILLVRLMEEILQQLVGSCLIMFPIYRVLDFPGDAGFLPSTVSLSVYDVWQCLGSLRCHQVLRCYQNMFKEKQKLHAELVRRRWLQWTWHQRRCHLAEMHIYWLDWSCQWAYHGWKAPITRPSKDRLCRWCSFHGKKLETKIKDSKIFFQFKVFGLFLLFFVGCKVTCKLLHWFVKSLRPKW